MIIRLRNEKYLDISFDKSLKGIKIISNGARKFIDSFLEKGISIFGLKLTYCNENYNDVIHVVINTKDKFEKCPQKENIDILKMCLNIWCVGATPSSWYSRYDYDYLSHRKPPFNYNWGQDKDGNIEYYLTVKKEWLLIHNLGVLSTFTFVDCYLDSDEISKKFPEYNPHNTKHIKYVN